MPAPLPEIRIDIVSDVVCPWCFIGYRQLERAMTSFADRACFAVHWHPFELAPAMPPEGQASRDYMRDRYGATPEQSRASRTRLIEIGALLGIGFAFSDNSRIYNTHKAHELLLWSADHGRQTALKLALFDAYFTRSLDISDDAVLIAAATHAGLDPEGARAVLTDRRLARPVDAQIAYWADHDISAVPAFIIDGRYMIPGAQDPEVFVRLFARTLAAHT